MPPPEAVLAAPVLAAQDFPKSTTPSYSSSPQSPLANPGFIPPPVEGPTANLPAIIEKSNGRHRKLFQIFGWLVLVVAALAWPIFDRNPIVKVLPGLRVVYEELGLKLSNSWDGLIFDQVKSELRYDSGTMKLYVDGVIHNTTTEVQFIPAIRARALGPDRRIVQSWSIDPPQETIPAGADVPFHTEIAAPMEHTIENVYLEFYAREVKRNDSP
jgi:hypothetical protein